MLKKLRFDRTVRSRKVMYSSLAFVLIAITTITLAYATLSTTLSITGTAEFQETGWSLLVEETAVPDGGPSDAIIDGTVATIGDGKILTKPTISGTSILNFKVQLTKPGDQTWMFYKITNTGDIPAVLDAASWTDPTFTSSTNNSNDINLIANNYMNVAYLQGHISIDGETNGYNFEEGDVLCPGASIELHVLNGFNQDAESVPSSSVNISNISIDFNFIATDKKYCNGSTPAETPLQPV